MGIGIDCVLLDLFGNHCWGSRVRDPYITLWLNLIYSL